MILNSRLLEFEAEPRLTEGLSEVEIEYKRYFFYEENEYLVVETVDKCTAGEIYTLHFDGFKGELSTTMDGFYRSEYRDENGNNRCRFY